MVTGTSNINTDPGSGRTRDPAMALSCSSGPDITMALGSNTGFQIYLVSAAACPSATNTDASG